jgi:hypothetical protein
MLAPLAYNGGIGMTHSLLVGSPAIDTGNNAKCPGLDQRGFSRLAHPVSLLPTCDIGAFEFQ